MTSMAFAPPPSRSRPPPDPPPRKFPLLGSLYPFEMLEPPDPPDVSPALRRSIFTSPSRRLSSAVHLVVALSLWFTWSVGELLMLLGFLTSFAVTNCEKCPDPSLMTALTSDLFHETCTVPPSLRSSRNLQWPNLKNLRRASPSLSSWTMNLLPSGKIFISWTWCERELHSDVLLLLLDGSVKIYSSEYQVAFSPVRNPLLEELLTSVFSPQTSFRYTPPGCYSKSSGTKLFAGGSRKDPSQTCLTNHTDPFCSLRARSLSLDGFGLSPQTPLAVAHTDKCSPLLSFWDFTDQWPSFGLVKSSWLQYGNAGRGSFFLNSLLARLEPIAKLISRSVGLKGKISESSYPWSLVTGVDTQQLCYLISCYSMPKSEQPCCVVGFLVQSLELQKLQTKFIINVQL
ncbi:hypothetical protein Bca4012_063812 [Brassica carinata]